MPVSPVEDLDLDSDSSSLESCSTSPNPSPASSGFTSPSTSPTASTFLVSGDDGTPLGQVEFSIGSVHRPSFSPPTMRFPSSLAASPEFGFPSSSSQYSNLSSNFLPELQFDALGFPSQEKSDSRTTYEAPHFANAQFISGSESPQTSSVKHMPGISPPHLTMTPPGLPPRPTPIHTSACDPPVHIPALRSPTLPPTPNLVQSQQWTNQQSGQAEGQEVSATHLVRQRQRARMMLTRAASLPEPRNLPVYRPQAHHLYSYPLAGPPRSRTGAYSRRVNVAPRVLGKTWWDPWRKGGVLDRAALADNRRKLRTLEEALREERALEAADEAEGQLTGGTKSGDATVPNGQAEDEEGIKESENDEVPLASQETEDAEQGGSYTTRARAQDEALLMTTLIASLDPNSCPSPGSIDDTLVQGLCPDKSTAQNSDTMQVYIEDGVMVTPPVKQAIITSDTAPEDGTAPCCLVSTKDAAIIQSGERPSKYVPRSKSPLNQSFVAPPPITRLHIPSVHEVGAEVLSAGRAWRKFTSMMF
ncbi:hypothetical protein FRC06_000376 [Ceratobasidium sp. 370]|nr:hypothetical protein FRC06_000376 [Ceratobasidium sp. 370]